MSATSEKWICIFFFFFLPQIYFERLGNYNLVSASCITVNIQWFPSTLFLLRRIFGKIFKAKDLVPYIHFSLPETITDFKLRMCNSHYFLSLKKKLNWHLHSVSLKSLSCFKYFGNYELVWLNLSSLWQIRTRYMLPLRRNQFVTAHWWWLQVTHGNSWIFYSLLAFFPVGFCAAQQQSLFFFFFFSDKSWCYQYVNSITSSLQL